MIVYINCECRWIYKQKMEQQVNWQQRQQCGLDWQQRQQSGLGSGESYLEYLEGVELIYDNLDLIPEEVQLDHKIFIYHKERLMDQHLIKYEDCYFGIKNSRHHGLEYTYDVILGNFKLQLYVLHLNRNSDSNQHEIQKETIGAGGYGSVRQVRIQNYEFAIKRINFKSKIHQEQHFDLDNQKAQYFQIRKAIRQYCIYKIFSMLNVGPKVIFQNAYDLICYNNCIQFTMELCQVPSKNSNFCLEKNIPFWQFEEDMKKNLKMMHFTNFIHKDIKPDNVLYSNSQGKFVLADFGMTHTVIQKENEKTLTFYEGTINYSSNEMRELLGKKTSGFVNLYVNDLHALQLTIKKFRENMVREIQSMSKNSMSASEEVANSFESYMERYNENEEGNGQNDEYTPTEMRTPTNRMSPSWGTGVTEGPIKFVSQINYYEAKVLYEVCRSKSAMLDVTRLLIESCIKKVCCKCQNLFISHSVHEQVTAIFFPDIQLNCPSFLFSEMKNAARNYGPNSLETIACIDHFITHFKHENHQVAYFLNIKQKLEQSQYNQIEESKRDVEIHRQFWNNQFFASTYLKVLRGSVNIQKKNHTYLEKQQKKELIWLIKHFLFFQKLKEITEMQASLANSLILRCFSVEKQRQIKDDFGKMIFNEKSHESGEEVKQRYLTSLIIKECICFLKENNSIEIEDYLWAYYTLMYIVYEKTLQCRIYGKCIEQMLENQTDLYRVARTRQFLWEWKRKDNFSQDNHQSAYQMALESKLIIQKSHFKDTKIHYVILDQLCLSLIDLKRFEEAFALAQDCLAIKKADSSKINENGCHVAMSYKYIGVSELKLNRFESGIQSLKTSLSMFWALGEKNSLKIIFQIMNNLAGAYEAIANLEESLYWLHRMLTFIDSMSRITWEKSYTLVQILRLKLTSWNIHQHHPAQRQQINSLVENVIHTRVQSIFSLLFLKNCFFNDRLTHSELYEFWNQSHLIEKSKEIYVKSRCALVLRRSYIDIFDEDYLQLNIGIARYYKENQQRYESLKYLWNYIEIVFGRKSKGIRLSPGDFQVMNLYTESLVKINSQRRALLFLKKYIYWIPLNQFQIRKTAFHLLAQVTRSISKKQHYYFKQITNNHFQLLKARTFDQLLLPQENHSNILQNAILKKWFKKL